MNVSGPQPKGSSSNYANSWPENILSCSVLEVQVSGQAWVSE